MPAATATAVMVLTNVGLQLFNNWRNTQTSDEMRRKQQEFQRAAQDRNHDRMMQLLREGQALQEQWETENHEQRIKNINDDFDNLIKRTFHSQALQSWPLSVLPMVMKNQSLGSFRTQSDENIALHVILTPSNSDTFNATVFSQIELGVEAFCNRHWNNLSQHPIIFYGGAWKSKTSPEQTEIDQLKADLTHLPILMITPFFTPDSGKLVFNINMWGMGKRQTNRNDEQFDINSTEMVIQPTEQEFSYYNLYALDTNYGNELTDVTIEEFVPYLQCMIGYLADVYFWSAHNRTPILPTLLSIGTLQISYKQQTNVIEGYKNLFYSNIALLNETPTDSGELTILSGYLLSTSNLLDKSLFQRQLESLYLEACNLRGYKTNDIQKAIVYAAKKNIFLPSDTDFLKQFAVLHKVENKVKKTKNHYNMKTLNATEYSEKRNELLGLIDQVLKVDGIKEEEKTAFLSTQKRLQENQFNIVLIGEFQGGKSTTFNALCGGREISPRGAMNKTSAICITATNIADPKTDEYAIVNWKSNIDLLRLMDSFISSITPEDLGVTLGQNESFSIYQHFSFDNPKHIEILRNRLEIQERAYKFEPNKHQEFSEVLRIAKLIIAFANDLNIKQIQTQNKFKIEEVAKYAVFPKEWEGRWAKINNFEDIKVQFKSDDVIFAFVSDINCHIRSENLARLGCSVTDCPGLFASSWDTSVAINAMSQANAVIYLLGGNKQMGEGDERAITKIFQQNSLANKVFFAVNRKDNDTVTANIINEDVNKLRNLGISNNTIWDFNALLFFLSEFGQMVLNSTIDNFSKEKFIEVAKRNGYSADTIEDIWKKIIRRVGSSMDNDNLMDIQHINDETIITIRKASSSDVLLTTINDSIITQKAESILINNGATKVKETLDKIDARLRSTENDALKTVEESEAEFQEATDAYQSFITTIKDILSKAFPTHLALQIARNGYMEITQSSVIDAIALRLSVEIPKAITIKGRGNAAWQELMSKFSNKEGTNWAAKQRDEAEKKLKSLLEPIVSSAIETELSSAINLWQDAIYDGTHNDYHIYIQPTLDSTTERITKEWDNIVIGNDMLAGFTIDKIDISDIIHYIDKTKISHNGDVIEVTGKEALKDIIRQIVVEIVAVLTGLIVTVLVDLFLFAGLGTVLGTLTWLLTRCGLLPGDPENVSNVGDLNKKQKEFYDRLRPALGDTFQKEQTRNDTVQKLKQCPENIFKGYTNYYLVQSQKQSTKLQFEIEEKRRIKQTAIDAQMEIAQKAKQIREQQIQPLTQKINIFIDSCYK